ncbi:MAG: mycothiol synthase [Acidimicrobiales bacterium]|jgi:mycothiol synthase
MDEPVVDVVVAPDQALADDVADLMERIVHRRGPDGLSDDRRRALARTVGHGGRGFLAVEARDPVDGRLVGYAQIDRVDDLHDPAVEVVTEQPDRDGPTPGGRLADLLLDEALRAFRSGGGGRLRLWVTHATVEDDRRLARRGFGVERDLVQMRCRLPLPASAPAGGTAVATRPFRVGVDEEAWLVANNRAFAGHPEQGDWDLATLREREAEPWFDPDGFLVLDVDGRLAGSCWTKVHRDERPPVGEIYVIGVDPAFHGRGWGRALTHAGLDHLASIGLTAAMLYVDAANVAAATMYRSMGFVTDHVDRSYLATVAGPHAPT